MSARSRSEVDEVVRNYWNIGVRHIVALRGDPPEGAGARYAPHPGGYDRAADLVAGIRAIGEFEISVAGYPEMHPESPSLNADLDNLKAKVDAGATRIITQFFFDNDHYLRFIERVRDAGIWCPVVPGIVPIHNFGQVARFAERCGADIPPWLARRFEGLDNDPATTHLVAAAMAAEQVMDLVDHGIKTFPLLYPQPGGSGLRDLPFARPEADSQFAGSGSDSMTTRTERIELLKEAVDERILVTDGAMGTMIQRLGLEEADYRGPRFADWAQDLKGNNDLLVLTQPEKILDIHRDYLAAGADIVGTNTFNAQSISLADYGMEELSYEMNVAAAELARRAADEFSEKDADRPRFVAGAVGPTNRTASLSPDVNNPGFRNVDFDQLVAAYGEQVRGLVEGGVDVVLIETIFDTLNAKAAGYATLEAFDALGVELPIMISGTITDRSGRTLSGQTAEAFWYSMRHLNPFSIGLNCALGAELMRPHVVELAMIANVNVSAYPNAGLPNAMGEYDETPEQMAEQLGAWAKEGLVNIVGGCCGSTPEHISTIVERVTPAAPRTIPRIERKMRLSGLEPFVQA